MKRLYLDTETCGLHGVPVLLQYAVEDGPVILYDIWHEPIQDTLRLLEWMAEHTVVGFHLSFDWFHICKLYTLLSRCPREWRPIDHIDQLAGQELAARDGLCLKPASALDLMLHARKGPCQELMRRNPIRIKRVRPSLAYKLADELDQSIEFDDILFAGRKDGTRWKVFPRDDGWRDVVLRFAPRAGLKYLADYLLDKPARPHFAEVGPDQPDQLGYAPFCNWADVIREHVEHWRTSTEAREYAREDIEDTRDLDRHFGSPEPGDDDSVLACMVGAIRWHGYRIDTVRINSLRGAAERRAVAAPINVNSTNQVREWITEGMDPTEQLLAHDLKLDATTGKRTLEAIAKWESEAGRRAQKVIDARLATKEVELYTKLLQAGRLHADLKVIGTKSTRMSGAGGLNVQGIKRSPEVRECFPLAWDGMVLCGGDFDSFELTIADAEYRDPELRKAITGGTKLHTQMGMLLSGWSQSEVESSKGTENDWYLKGKSGVFALTYFGNAWTLHSNLGVPLDRAESAVRGWDKKFPDVARARNEIVKQFTPIKQPGGAGTEVVWDEPAEYVESTLGFRRYFTIENKVCRALFNLATSPPGGWSEHNAIVERTEGREQTELGALRSALYGCAFGLQGSVQRAAGNHRIQSVGGQICKRVQRRIWDLQPAGPSPWIVAPLNVHDEIMCVTDPDHVDAVAEVVGDTVESYRELIPLIGITWKSGLSSWAGK